MPGPLPARASTAPAALAQSAAALAAHVLAAGCLPDGRGLVLAVPATVVAVLLIARLLPDRPLARLAGGQLAGHLALSLVAACSGHASAAHAHADAGTVLAHPGTVLAHVTALLLLRAGLDRSLARLERAVAGLRRRWSARPAAVALPVLGRPVSATPAAPARRVVLSTCSVRGPPVGLPAS